MRSKIVDVELNYIWIITISVQFHIYCHFSYGVHGKTENVIMSYGVHFCSRKYSFLIWRMWDMDHDINYSRFNHIYWIFHPEGILDYYSSCIKSIYPDDIIYVIVINNIIHMSINESIIFLFGKYLFLHFLRIVRINCIHHYLILNSF